MLATVLMLSGIGVVGTTPIDTVEAHQQSSCGHRNFWSWGGWYKWWWVEYHDHYDNYGQHYHIYSHHDSRGEWVDHWEYKPC